MTLRKSLPRLIDQLGTRVVQPSGYTRLAPSSGYYDLTLGNGATAKDKNFRYTKP